MPAGAPAEARRGVVSPAAESQHDADAVTAQALCYLAGYQAGAADVVSVQRLVGSLVLMPVQLTVTEGEVADEMVSAACAAFPERTVLAVATVVATPMHVASSTGHLAAAAAVSVTEAETVIASVEESVTVTVTCQKQASARVTEAQIVYARTRLAETAGQQAGVLLERPPPLLLPVVACWE